MPPASPKAGSSSGRVLEFPTDSPLPEPMTIGAPSTSSLGLGSIMEVMPTPISTVPLKDEGTSPSNLIKARSKSTYDMKKKGSDAGASDEDLTRGSVFPNSVREGFLKKKGVVNVSWKKRYIVLLTHQLAYYDELPRDHTILPKGFISLTSITKVQHHDVNTCSFDVVTPTRIFRLQADSQADMDAWIASISGTAANEQQILASRKRNVSHAQLRGLTEEDRLKIDDSAKISHENAELGQWAKWSAFDVAAWLQTFGMARYCEAFYSAGVTGEKFKQLDDAALKQVMGPDSDKGDRIKILAHIKKLIQEAARN